MNAAELSSLARVWQAHPMAILTIHSHVACGHVGNAATVYPLQRMGHEVWPVHTVLLSHHPGHNGWHGAPVAAGDVAAVLKGLEAHGVLERCAAVLAGYLGAVAVGEAVLEVWHAVRTANPEAIIACDPILGDEAEGLYVPDALMTFYHNHAIPAADVIFPNRFELALLSDCDVRDVTGAVTAARTIMARGPSTVVAKSIPAGRDLATVLVTEDGCWAVVTPRLATPVKGAGDVLAALWLGYILGDANTAVAALGSTVSDVFSLLERAADGLLQELPLPTYKPAQGAPRFAAMPLDL